jgi:ArsR family transcriptional regulator
MPFHNHDEFTPEQVALADFARALSHPARIAILTFLQEHGQASCGQIVEALPLAQATVSQHLRAMREAGLLIAESCGPRVCYSLDCDNIKSFCHSFQCTLGTAPAAQATSARG